MVKIFTAPKNDKTLSIYITALALGVQLTTQPPVPNTASFFTCSVELDKNRTLEDPEAICRMLLTKNVKVKYMPDNGTADYFAAEELLEKLHAKDMDHVQIAKLVEQRMSNDSQFLVASKLSLVDICAWSALYGHRDTLSGPVAQWFNRLAEEKFFKAGVKAAGF